MVGLAFKIFHQCDPFSSYNVPIGEDGIPDRLECSKRDFVALFSAPEVASSWEYFYDNKNGIQDKFADYWRVVAKKFDGNSNVMGYGLLNEPWNANMYKDSSLVTDTKKFDREKLTPLYKKVTEAIREVD